MADIIDPQHEALVEHLFRRTCSVLGLCGYTLKPLRRRKRGEGRFRTLVYGYTRIGHTEITVDLYTPRTMKTRKMDAILRVICHELTHHQEPPRIVSWWGRRVRMIHHPKFWKRYKQNVVLISKDELLGSYFVQVGSS